MPDLRSDLILKCSRFNDRGTGVPGQKPSQQRGVEKQPQHQPSFTAKIQTQATPLGKSAPIRKKCTVPQPLSLNLPSHQHQT